MNTSDSGLNNLVLGNSNYTAGSLSLGTGGNGNGLRVGFIEFINPSNSDQSAYLGFTNYNQLILTSNVNYLGSNAGTENATNNGEIAGGTGTVGTALMEKNNILVLGRNGVLAGNSVLSFN